MEAARSIAWTEVQAVFVDVDDVAAARIVAADNRTAQVGSYDEAALTALLVGLDSTELGLDGTGYDAIAGMTVKRTPTDGGVPTEIHCGPLRIAIDEEEWSRTWPARHRTGCAVRLPGGSCGRTRHDAAGPAAPRCTLPRP
ncbi:MAG: hypothetical protein Q4G35_03310 [Propionibacteriaceae bacterium]|nr:hypothetical protein [Propionibacteriaceae bacterium]